MINEQLQTYIINTGFHKHIKDLQKLKAHLQRNLKNDEFMARPANLRDPVWWHSTRLSLSLGVITRTLIKNIPTDTIVKYMAPRRTGDFVQLATFMTVFLSSYYTFQKRLIPMYKRMSNSSIKNILSNSGPCMIKMLQQYSDNTTSKLKYLLEAIFNSTPPMNDSQLREINLDPDDLKLLGSASLANVFKTSWHDQPAALKVLRPSVVYILRCEIDFMLHELWNNLGTYDPLLTRQMRRIMVTIIINTINELDYRLEAAYTTRGYEVYNGRSAMILDYRKNPTPTLLTTFMRGFTLADWQHRANLQVSDANMVRVVQSFNELWKQWLTNIFFGDGFFHADLHSGNLIVDMNTMTLNVIDYGSSAIMTKRVGRVFLKAMIQSGKLKDLSVFMGGTIVPKGAVAAAFPPGTRLTRDVTNEHQANLRVMKRFMVTLKTVCNIEDDLVDEDVLIRKLLQYPVKFIDLLGNFFRYSSDIGDCDHNVIIQFGKGLRYIGNAGDTLKAIVEKHYTKVKAEYYNIEDIIAAGIKSNPLSYTDLIIEAL